MLRPYQVSHSALVRLVGGGVESSELICTACSTLPSYSSSETVRRVFSHSPYRFRAAMGRQSTTSSINKFTALNSLLIFHAQAESDAYSRDSTSPFRFPLRLPSEPSCAIGIVPSLSRHAIAYRWRSLPRIRRQFSR